ncbi:MAG: glycosyltransferase family 2 protein [Selenomonadales bacterium]|nr:glycosyltransferase family 2 protein [Selenomonadales bacterium]
MSVSVIVPVYNAERFLPKAIESVLSQTYTDWELILVDDGSTDGSLGICETYAKRDRRIKVFSQDNQGVSSARNLGLGYACGAYVTFMDSDDELDTGAFEACRQDGSGHGRLFDRLCCVKRCKRSPPACT